MLIRDSSLTYYRGSGFPGSASPVCAQLGCLSPSAESTGQVRLSVVKMSIGSFRLYYSYDPIPQLPRLRHPSSHLRLLTPCRHDRPDSTTSRRLALFHVRLEQDFLSTDITSEFLNLRSTIGAVVRLTRMKKKQDTALDVLRRAQI